MTTRHSQSALAKLLLQQYEGEIRFAVTCIDGDQANELAEAFRELECFVEVHPTKVGRITVLRAD